MLMPGSHLGRYEIVQRLGAGGMGIVFRAHDSQLGRDVAVKVLPEHFAADPARLARFEREARAASALNHPNIVTIHEIGETQAQPYIVMEYVDGSTLREMIGPRPLPPRRVLELGAQLAQGLAKAHDAGIVHRDLKPENVMVTRDGVVKVLDFGLSKPPATILSRAAAPGSEADTAAGELRTESGAIIGTVGYMAPEQARGEVADHRADQFALGAILYEMATGRRAFQRDSAIQTLADIIERDPEPIEALNPEFPAPARWAIHRCLAKEPAGRYASTHDLAGELLTIRDHLGETAGSGASTRHAVAAPRRLLRTWQAAVFAALVVAGVLAGPPAWRTTRSWLLGPRLPDVLRVAVLPTRGETIPGLQHYVISRLSGLHGDDGRFAVIPASEILDTGCRTPSEATRAVKANVSVEIAVEPTGDGHQVTAQLADEQRVLTSDVRVYRVVLPEEVAQLVVALLKSRFDARARSEFAKGAPAAGGVDVLFAEALQETPYQQARTAAERFDQEQSLQRAISLYNKAIDAAPNYAAARAGLGEAYLRLYYYTRNRELLVLARQSLERALKADDTRPSAWMALGMLHTLQGDTVKAEEALRNAIRRDPSGGSIHRELGAAYEAAGRLPEAEAAFREAVRLQDDSWANHAALGRFLAGQRRFEEAQKEFNTALQQVPDNSRVLASLGGVYLYQQRWDEATALLNRAVEVNPRSGGALSNIGSIHYNHHRNYALAADYYARATVASPRDYRPWYNLGLAREAVPALQPQAAAAYRQAATLLREELKVNPNNASFHMRLADCLAAVGEGAEARQSIAAALQRQAVAEDLRIAAKAEELLGNREAALGYLRRAFDLGLSIETVEQSSPTLVALRNDRRYTALVKAVRAKNR